VEQVIELVHSFFHSGYFFSASSNPKRRSRHNSDTVSEFHAEAPQTTASEDLAQGPSVAARVWFEPATLRTKGDESSNEPPRPAPVGNWENEWDSEGTL